MEHDREWVPNQYEPCEDEDDPGWHVCLWCGAKVYIGAENKSDAVRHEERCEFR